MPNPRYDLLLADADNTLFDFHAAEKAALADALAQWGLPRDEGVTLLYSRINQSLWEAHERGEISQEALKTERFLRLLRHLPPARVGAPALALAFTEHLGRYAFLMPGALSFVRAVHPHMPIVLVTNGIARVQRARLMRSQIAPYIAGAFISEEVGASKPDPRMLLMAMEHMGIGDKGRAILLGDSLSADIEAARRGGIACIHLCGPGNTSPHSPADFQAESLEEAQRILLGG